MADRCLLCGSASREVLEEETHLIRCPPPCHVVRCLNCGLTFLDPQPGADELKAAYGEGYFRAYQERGIPFAGGDGVVPPAHLRERLARIEALAGKGRLLEVGCAFGAFLGYARQRGWEVQGVELSEWAARIAQERFSIEVFCGTLEEARFPAGLFDVVHMNHVLEHLRDPLATLLEVRRVLKANGILAVEVPNEFGDLLQRFRCRILRRLPVSPEVPSPHLFFFTPSTLRSMVEKAGFSILFIKTPRRNRDCKSEILGGGMVKRLIYFAEGLFRRGPLIEVLARKGGS